MEEEFIIKSVLNGNINDFEQLVIKYQSLVFAICMNIVKDPLRAEDISQETFFQAYKSLGNYKFKGFKAWVCKIAANKAIDYKRKMKQNSTKNIICMDESLMQNIEDSSNLQEDFIKRDERDRMQCLVKKLPPKYSTVIYKYYNESKTYDEIASEEGISLKTVESRLYRAKILLRKKWKEDT